MNKIIAEKSRERNRKLVAMLVFTNGYFLACSLPLCTSIIYFNLAGVPSHFQSSARHLQTAFYALAYSNNSINALFFWLFSHKYRQTFSSLFFRFRTNPQAGEKSGSLRRKPAIKSKTRSGRHHVVLHVKIDSNVILNTIMERPVLPHNADFSAIIPYIDRTLSNGNSSQIVRFKIHPN